MSFCLPAVPFVDLYQLIEHPSMDNFIDGLCSFLLPSYNGCLTIYLIQMVYRENCLFLDPKFNRQNVGFHLYCNLFSTKKSEIKVTL
jgi:hypothetical protein